MKHVTRVLSALLVLGLPGVAAADAVGVPGSPGTPPVIANFKTPPLATSQTIVVPLAVHFSQSHANWAGALFSIHVQDPQEVDVLRVNIGGPGILPGSFPSPFGGQSQNVQSQALFFTAWHTLAYQSGITVRHSTVQRFGSVVLHAKETTPRNNSDIDLSGALWNIFHVPPGPGSSIITILPSDYVYGTSSWDPNQSELPPFPPEPGFGHWVHWDPPDGRPKTFHLPPGSGSWFWATKVGTATLGIEHVPEPATGLLLGGGFLALGASRWLRRRRTRPS